MNEADNMKIEYDITEKAITLTTNDETTMGDFLYVGDDLKNIKYIGWSLITKHEAKPKPTDNTVSNVDSVIYG